MSIALVHVGCILPLMTVSAIALSVCRGVGGCLCPNSLSMILVYTALHAMMYSPPNSALVANDMTFFITCAMLSTVPLFGGTVCCWRERSVRQLYCVLWACFNSLHQCGLLIPYCLSGKRVRCLSAWLGS